tara:strand:+ start:163 stop:675 length:513 start_codon:yes stop_codon:yes gene_type:complete
MKRLLFAPLLLTLLVGCSNKNKSAIEGTYDTKYEKDFLELTADCKKYRVFTSNDETGTVAINCIIPKLKELGLDGKGYGEWAKKYNEEQKKLWEDRLNYYGSYNEKKESTSKSDDEALSVLCKIGLNADGGIWKNKEINAAISIIKWGNYWPDNVQATAYKTCNSGGYLK